MRYPAAVLCGGCGTVMHSNIRNNPQMNSNNNAKFPVERAIIVAPLFHWGKREA
jgi:hypothetical protein